MADFWDRKKQELYPQRNEPVAITGSPGSPWWSHTSYTGIQSQRPVQGQQELDLGYVDGHDVSKAGILKGDAEECDYCPRDPRTGIRGNMYRPSKSAAMRCFDCGYIAGRNMGEGQSRIAKVEGRSQQARQTVTGGARGNNFQGEIRSANDPRIVGRIT